MSTKANLLKVALIQMGAGANKPANVEKAMKLVKSATVEGSKLVVLPECFNSPYGTKYFPEYAEKIPGGETCNALSQTAKENNVFIVGGSIPEKDGDKLYNTSTIWNPEGKLLGIYRKLHLFDIDIPGEMTFFESDVLTKGDRFTTFDIGSIKVGLGICYDLRFGELANIYCKQDVDMIIYPGAFNMKTGPLHWELLLRARAVDNQVFVAGVSTAQDPNSDYVSWGHSMLVDPWGKILTGAEGKETTLFAEIDCGVIKKIRQQIPVQTQKRTDMYEIVSKASGCVGKL